MLKRTLPFIALIVGLQHLASAALLISSITPGSSSGSDVIRGNLFTVGTTDLTVTSLGYAVPNGTLINSHEVGIWRVSDQAVMVQGTVTNSDPTDTGFKYTTDLTVTTSTTLSAGESYIIGAQATSNDLGYFNPTGTLGSGFDPSTTFASLLNPSYHTGFSGIPPSFPTYPDEIQGVSFIVASFGYEQVPEPGTWVTLAGLGALAIVLIRRRISAA